jgi:hypothetical protein
MESDNPPRPSSSGEETPLVAQEAEALYAIIESEAGSTAERLERVIGLVARGSQVENACHAGGWTSEEFKAILAASPRLTKRIELAEAEFVSKIEMEVASQTGNPQIVKFMLSSRGFAPQSDRRGHVELERQHEEEEYELEEGDLNEGFNPREPEEPEA